MQTTTTTLRATLVSALLAGTALVGTAAYAAAADNASGPAGSARPALQLVAEGSAADQLYRPRFAEPLPSAGR